MNAPTETADDRLRAADRLCERGQHGEASKLYQSILADCPDQPMALQGLGRIASRIGMPERAIRLLRKSLRAGGESAESLNDLGKAFVETGDLENAERCFRRCIQRYPRSSLGYLGQAFLEVGRENFDEAAAIYEAAVTHTDNCPEVDFNLATFYRERGRLDESIAIYSKMLKSDPGNAWVRDGRSRALLQKRLWRDGWQDYESRFEIDQEVAKINLDLPIPRWRGESLQDKHLLVLYEQGIGDEVQFASCYQDVIDAAARCTLTCSPRLKPTFARSFGNAQWQEVSERDRQEWSPSDPETFDYFVPAGSLPRHLRNEDTEFPQRPYLRARESKEHDSIPRVGVSWWGGVAEEQIRKRSVPWPSFRSLLDVDGIRFINLQHGSYTEETIDPQLADQSNLETREHLDPYSDLEGWFELISSLDLVVSVDNSNVHFAGALGIETWLLLSDSPNWRWPAGLSSSNWYRSVQFVAKQQRPWEAVMDEVASRLKSRFAPV